MKVMSTLALSVLAASLMGCNKQPSQAEAPVVTVPIATGAPGVTPYWAYSGKTGIGTSFEQYLNGQYSDNAPTKAVSKVWFSIAQGLITETMFGLIHQAQIKDMQFVVKGADFIATERDDTTDTIEYLSTDEQGRPQSLAYKITTLDKQGRFKIEKHVFTDPSDQSLFVRVVIESFSGPLTAYVSANPYVNNNGVGDSAAVENGALVAWEGDNVITLKAASGFKHAMVGFTGISDGLTQLQETDALNNLYQQTGSTPGNVSLFAELGSVAAKGAAPTQFDLVLSFGKSKESSLKSANATLKRGYDATLSEYNGEGDFIGWQDYLASLKPLNNMTNQTTDNGKLLYTSALVLKAQEDKTHAGAVIASLSNPWGDTVKAIEGSTGYKAVWVRDFYQVAMAFLALGDNETAKIAFEYLEKVQVSANTPGNGGDTGWFLQKTHVDGELEWVGVQLDQTAMPIMLAWKLWQAQQLSDSELINWYQKMLKPAADFLVKGGRAKILWNDTHITPPMTQQERWEEQAGHSPSTTAAVIAGLITAADIAKAAGDVQNSALYLATARGYSAHIEAQMVTTQGTLPGSDGHYYIRINQNEDANSDSKLGDNNGRTGLDKKQILDGGFLELVRYGVRSADDSHVVASLNEYDDETLPENLRVKYSFKFAGQEGSFAGWRRYGNDGYGEDETTGSNYAATGGNTPGQRGRVWPFFTGERGHYELARAKQVAGEKALSDETMSQLKLNYVKAMELFANEGMMLPEQVWDNVGVNPQGYTSGEGTNSATPLAWTHAEYVKLIKSLTDQAVWDYYPIVAEQLKQ
ncbi:glucan 1,4-alpha-glucosidase [Pseudoalteromonas tunicata]|uniref:Glucoamylase n=1 Tax=Pseudoalteromonas tunicata D2 TaxID=87626 RepID=A4CBZ5_9GAMM|nr:glucan 1,4-alpha-glucosidase [Pseudoalteromonas tunicata]ATC94431.1 glucoamylase [Pseudoalteromonas tunicata]AXT30163.1 glucan 1,4-alpha-glucosidase [Pseudoalteromonas tunicata]EAR27882.1 glucoamylase [Pseudoalteromonas tunicata D2]